MPHYYKLFNRDMRNRGYQFVEGLNEMPDEVFDPTPDCLPGAFYFADEHDIMKWVYMFACSDYLESLKDKFDGIPLIAEITTPPDAIVIAMADKFKTNKIIIHKPISLREFLFSRQDLAIQLFSINPIYIKLVLYNLRNIDMVIFAIIQDLDVIQFINPELLKDAKIIRTIVSNPRFSLDMIKSENLNQDLIDSAVRVSSHNRQCAKVMGLIKDESKSTTYKDYWFKTPLSLHYNSIANKLMEDSLLISCSIATGLIIGSRFMKH